MASKTTALLGLLAVLSLVSQVSSYYIGCYWSVPYTIKRTMFSFSDCEVQCGNIPTLFAAITGTNCYCGNRSVEFGALDDINCTRPCPLNATQYCGGEEGQYSVSFIGSVEPEVQWVARVLNYSSEYTDDYYSAIQVTGVTDVFPQSGDNPFAWSPKEPSAGLEFLELEIPVPVHIKEVKIFETEWPGAIVKVLSREDSNANWNVIWQGPTTFELSTARVFRPNVSSLSFAVSQLRIELNTANSYYWPAIDAVQVVSYQGGVGVSRGSSAAFVEYPVRCRPQLSLQYSCPDLVPILGFDPCSNSSQPQWTDSSYIVDNDESTFGSCPFGSPQRLRFYSLNCNNDLPPVPITSVYARLLLFPSNGDYWQTVTTAWKTGPNAERGNNDYIYPATVGLYGGIGYYLGDGTLLGLSSLHGADIANLEITFEAFGDYSRSELFEELWVYDATIHPVYSILATSNNGWPKITTAPAITSGLITTSRIQVTRVTSGRGVYTTGTGELTTSTNENETSDATSKHVALLSFLLLLFI